jgi:hypothetical protein
MKPFWERIDRSGGTEACWPWKTEVANGRGRLRINGAATYGYRHAWSLENGPIPDGMFICHHCDNPACCNPKHLFLGTGADNARDCWLKGRNAEGRRGSPSRGHKLDRAGASLMRFLLSQGARTKDVADWFGITRQMVRKTEVGECWFKC